MALDAPRTWQLANASINRLLHSGEGLVLVGWADVAHLEAVRDDSASPAHFALAADLDPGVLDGRMGSPAVMSRYQGLPSASWPAPTIFWPVVSSAVTPEELDVFDTRVLTKVVPTNFLPLSASTTYR